MLVRKTNRCQHNEHLKDVYIRFPLGYINQMKSFSFVGVYVYGVCRLYMINYDMKVESKSLFYFFSGWLLFSHYMLVKGK